MSKAKMGQRARCPRRGQRPASAVSHSEMEPNGDKRRGFAVGAPARRSRDGNGKIAVRGGEAMAAKRTAAQGVRSEMPRPILRGKPKRRGR